MRPRDWLWKAASIIALLALPLGAAGCLPSLDDPDLGPLTRDFAVSDIFAPSGFMGDGAKAGFLTVDFDQAHCRMPRPSGARGNCYTFTYYADWTSDNPWAGVYWVFPTNSWGSRPGYAFDPSKFQQVRFYAAVDMPTPNTNSGGLFTTLDAIAGGVDNMRHYGPTCQSINDFSKCEHDDLWRARESFTIGTDVGPELKQFHIPIVRALANASDPTTGAMRSPDELLGAFAWSMHFPDDSCACSEPSATTPAACRNAKAVLDCPRPVKIYLDDIVWDTAPPPSQ